MCNVTHDKCTLKLVTSKSFLKTNQSSFGTYFPNENRGLSLTIHANSLKLINLIVVIIIPFSIS